jgi:carboxyl-terminal processing protease
MRSRYFKLGGIALLISVSSFLFIAFQNNMEDLRRDLLLKVISFAISNGHYNPGEINDDFSEKAFTLYIERMDFGKRFLLQEDIEELSKYKKELDNAMNDVNFEFFDLSVSILDKRTKESEAYYKEILSHPFDFTANDKVEIDAKKLDFAKDKNEMKGRWNKLLKYETMNSLYDLDDEQKQASEKSDTVTIKSFAALEEKAREKVLKRYSEYFHRLSKLNQDDRLDVYVNSLVNVFDPHTEYFPPKDKENFDIRFSGQLEGIGAQLTQKDYYIEVANIVPGSPSWKDGELEPGDIILKVAQGDEEFVDLVDMRLDEAVLLIRGKKGTVVRLSIKKKIDGALKEISLIRDVVVLEDTYAKSAIINDPKSGKNYGYLKLPSFYVDFGNVNGRNCYDDVKAEIEKLKSENVSGIIFDLRDDGGGSLEDVVKIAGLFIKDGPIVQSVGSKGAKKIHKDLDPQVQYGGTLVVMVNAISASASEIFAAAMQDYNRAIIIGGNSTYGKGTVQNFTELDRMVPKKPADMEDLGSLKMTVQKFYRIDGGATQRKGVIPDIIVPDYYNYMEFNESFTDYSMPWDEISSLSYSTWDLGFDKQYISTLSEKRINNDTIFNLIEENGKRLKDIRDNTNITLNYNEYAAEIDRREQEGKKYDRIGKDQLNLAVNILKADMANIESDTSKHARLDAWISGLKKDVYLLEATNILKDIDSYQIQNAKKEE